MNVRTTAFSCPDCNLPLTGPGPICDCPGFPSAEILLENEARFAPVETQPVNDSIAPGTVQAKQSDADQLTDMDTTVVRSRSLSEPLSFATAVDASYATRVVPAQKASASASGLIVGFLRSAALVAMAGFVGGVTVLYFQPVTQPPAQTQQTVKDNPPQAVTDISSSGPFINRTQQDAPLVPEESSPAAVPVDGKPAPRRALANEAERARSPHPDPAMQPVEPTNAEDRESKVGAYVAENPAARKPTARCADGTYSFAASKDQACVGRGGVSDANASDKTPVRNAAYVLGPRGGCYYLDASGKRNYVDKKYCN